MNKKLEEIRNELDSHSIEQVRLRFKEGFNAAIDLNLPVLFMEWREKNGLFDKYTGQYRINGFIYLNTTQDLYNYWLDNVYKTTLK